MREIRLVQKELVVAAVVDLSLQCYGSQHDSLGWRQVGHGLPTQRLLDCQKDRLDPVRVGQGEQFRKALPAVAVEERRLVHGGTMAARGLWGSRLPRAGRE